MDSINKICFCALLLVPVVCKAHIPYSVSDCNDLSDVAALASSAKLQGVGKDTFMTGVADKYSAKDHKFLFIKDTQDADIVVDTVKVTYLSEESATDIKSDVYQACIDNLTSLQKT
jgi:hypothetical protein